MFWWTLENLILSAILAAAVYVVCQVRGVGPAARHALWLVVLVKMVTPPLIVWPWAISNPLAGIEGRIVAQARPATVAQASVEEPMARESLPPTDAPLVDDAREDSPPQAPQSVFTADSAADFASDAFPRATDAAAAPSIAASGIAAPAVSDALVWTAWAWPAAGAIWLLGSVAFAALQAVRIASMLRRLRRAAPVDEALMREVGQMAARLQMRPIETTKVSGVGSPFVWAIVRPRLLWPAELPTDLPLDSLRGLILHELAHVKRKDHWVGWLELVGGCLWWWNPLFWYVRGQLRENAELACDAWVVGTLPKGRRAYAEALLAVCECISQATAPLPAMGASTSDRRLIQRRLTMILRDRVPFRLSRVGMLAALLLAVTALPAWSQKPTARLDELESVAEPAAVPDALVQRWRRYRLAEFDFAPWGTLPPEVAAAMRRFETQEAEARQEAEKKIEQRREEMLRELQELQVRLIKEGRSDEAAALHVFIQRTRASAASTGRARPDPQWLIDYRTRVGESFVFDVTGTLGGTVWGTDVYTDDSSLAAAAVHAGVLKVGQRGSVRVIILPGKDSYTGSSHNGATSLSYGPWPGSYRLESVKEGIGVYTTTAASDPGSLVEYRDRVGQTLSFEVVGDTRGTVWGSDVYTDDSRLATAAVHAGILDVGQRGVVQVAILKGEDSYAGSTRNGIASQPYGAWDRSFRFVRGGKSGGRPKIELDSGSLMNYRDRVGQTFAFRVVGSKREDHYAIWGTGVYTDDSSLAMAAVHAGVLRDGQTGVVEVTILPGQGSYEGSTKNGVTSRFYERWDGSYRIVGARPDEAIRWEVEVKKFRPADSRIRPPGVRKVGESYDVELVGTTEGTVWGADVYTDDSSLAAAAVHAGVLEPGERATIRVTILEGRESYTGSTRHGVSTLSYGVWPRSFKVERVTTREDSVELPERRIRVPGVRSIK